MPKGGAAGIAAPVFDRSGEVTGAIGIIGPVGRLLAKPAREAHAVLVRETERNLSRDLRRPASGYSTGRLTKPLDRPGGPHLNFRNYVQ